MDILTRDLEYWNRVADDYDRSLVFRGTAEESSIIYEEFEDEYIDKIIERNKGNKIVLIELGSGTGRYLRRYANDDRVQYIIGIDFSPKIILRALKNLEDYKDKIGQKILIIQGLGEKTSISVDSIEELKDAIPIVICVFNTLGDIEPEERRLEVLKRMGEMIGERGIGIISVFNRELMLPDRNSEMSDCERYYYDDRIERLIVPPHWQERIKIIGRKIAKSLEPVQFDKMKGDVRTEDFYSHWFEKEEFVNLLKKANLKIITVEIGNRMRDYKAKRGLIAKVRKEE